MTADTIRLPVPERDLRCRAARALRVDDRYERPERRRGCRGRGARVKKRKSRLDATNPCVLYQMMRNPNNAGAACGANSKLELVEDYVLPALVQIRKCGPTPGPGGSSDILDMLDHHMTSDFNNTFRAAHRRGVLGLSNKGREGANAILERYERLTATERTELRAFRDWTRDNITML